MRRKPACLAGLHIGPSASAPQPREGGHRLCARPTRSLESCPCRPREGSVFEKCPFRPSALDVVGRCPQGVAHMGRDFLLHGFCKHVGVFPWVGGVRRARFGQPVPYSVLRTSKKVTTSELLLGTRPATFSRTRCAAFHRCLSAASPRDAARLRVVVRVLREWVFARSAPANPLRSRRPARACL